MFSTAVMSAAAVLVVALGARALLALLAIPRRCSSCQQQVRSVGSRFCPLDGSRLRDGSWWLPLVRLGPWVAFLALIVTLVIEFIPAPEPLRPDPGTEAEESSTTTSDRLGG